MAYVTLRDENAVARIDVATRKVLGKVAVGPGPIQLTVTPDNRFVLVANQGTPERPGTTLSVIDAAKFRVVANITTGAGAHGVTVDPTGRFAYVTNTYANTLSVVDLAARRTVTQIPTGRGPNGVSFSALRPTVTGARNLALGEPAGDDHDSHH
ncbi:YncE family protein (plasmid) [Deinococcus sp. VB343]|uniref:YncE family protein n=1 Tax=Deinococcus sp. VB142 TaxID=3112952 RepID=A0AAU6Q845_9DEIO